MFETILQAKLKICQYGKNNKQSYDYAFFNQLARIKISILLVELWKLLEYFRGVKFHYVKGTHDINRLLTLVKIVLASRHKKQPNNTDSELKVHALHYANELLVLAFQKLLQTHQTSRNNKKPSNKGFWLWLLIF